MKVLRPLFDQVLLQPDEYEAERNGVLLPETTQKLPAWGRVIAVGPGRIEKNGRRIEPIVKAGDHVAYEKRFAKPVTLRKGEEEQKLLMVPESNGGILGVLDD